MVFGEFAYRLDAKNRFRIPSKLKADFESGAYITKGTNGCLFIFSKDRFEKLAEKFSDFSLFDGQNLLYVRMFFSGANELEFDGQGRALLSKNLLEFAGIEKDIVFLGVNDHVELWSADRYDEYSKNYDQDFLLKVGK